MASRRALPTELADLVERCVTASGTKGTDRWAVQRELAGHLQDALDAGQSIAVIAAEFGDPERTGVLIGRARARLRPRRVVAALRLAALGSAAAGAGLYVMSATALHLGTPAQRPWSIDRLPTALVDSRALDLHTASQLVDSLLAQMYTSTEAGPGRLTADGLRIVQRLKGVDRPPASALAVEPIYFAFPASRDAVRREADRVLGLAARAAASGPGSVAWTEFEREAARFDWTRPGAYRYVPLAILLPRLVASMRRPAG